MNVIAEFIVENIFNNNDEEINHSVMQYGGEMDMTIETMVDELFSVINYHNVENLEVLYDNHGIQRATLISFKYYERICEIGESFDSQRDYFWIRISPVNV